MAKQPPAPLQDTTAATIKALTHKINQLENGGNNRRGQYRKQADRPSHPMEKTVLDQLEDGIMITTVGHVDLISSIPVKHANRSKTQPVIRRKQQQPIQ
jgi:hypothetical protein